MRSTHTRRVGNTTDILEVLDVGLLKKLASKNKGKDKSKNRIYIAAKIEDTKRRAFS